MRVMRRYNKHQYVHPSKNIIVAWLCFGVLRWDMTTAHYVISWSQVWRHISWISTFISMYTHDFIRQMQGLKIFKGSIITSAITTRAGSNTTSSPTFLQNYTLQTNRFPWNANGLTVKLYYHHIEWILFILQNLHNIAYEASIRTTQSSREVCCRMQKCKHGS